MERKNGMSGGNKGGTLGDETRATHAGNHPHRNHGVINPPVYRASTILFPDVAALEQVNKDRLSRIAYGRYGTPTVAALEEAVTALEGGGRAIVLSSGLAAITATLLQHLSAGDHLLMVDTVYGPARGFCDKVLSKFGVETTYYDPLIGAGVAALIRPQTRVVYLEAPGSLTFEMQDVPAIAALRHRRGAAGDDGQHLGDAALLQAVQPRRRHHRSCRNEIHRRPCRCDDGHRRLPRRALPAVEAGHPRARPWRVA